MRIQDPIDDLFRRKLAHRREEAPMHLLDAVLARRRRQVSERRKRRSTILGAWLALLLLGGGTATILWSPLPAPAVEKSAPEGPDRIEEEAARPASAPTTDSVALTTPARPRTPPGASSGRP